jgi:5-methylcytosine-specific restriction enzyme A
MALRTVSRLRALPSRISAPAKIADPIYASPEHKAWRRAVINRAGGTCQHPGCIKGYPEHRLHADHIVELRDGGEPFDPANGQALCDEHHSLKTARARAERQASRS